MPKVTGLQIAIRRRFTPGIEPLMERLLNSPPYYYPALIFPNGGRCVLPNHVPWAVRNENYILTIKSPQTPDVPEESRDEDHKCEANHRKKDESDERAEWLMTSLSASNSGPNEVFGRHSITNSREGNCGA